LQDRPAHRLSKLTGEAELSPMMPALAGTSGRGLASSRIVGTASVDCRPAVGELWNTYLKPRSVIVSE
jgi:hypothetical protein